ncbi:unnamed protein product [Penicillium salamii]|uniref:PRISE-like Rossmann-fold domain-containing protein n=1 Tax=Penicillium salamii TaxID=1612424 RepID=A0A9W4IXT7_9EURO|nr:unnamed protein product [Penicillium salamii]CAG8219330.1 unnamed protein product [Penicillium salamii]CAG8332160.1 unnamed protein product [Penicillium salamii]CAG8360418.1 unnamed protein product [Penicillium salamii]CAG8361089.1 unnamed protein product [Penicillium salamii]
MADEGKTALVIGASGISGWAVAKNLLSYPTATTFSRVIGLTHRPRTAQEIGLPQDSRLEIYSGINLRNDLEDVKHQMRARIPNLEQVTHMYYCAYSNATAYTHQVMEIKDINVGMTYNAVHATDALCPELEFVVLQTGTNNYGVACFQYIDHIQLNPPLSEDNPRVPSPYGDEIFYYAQVDLINSAAQGKSWKWCEVRPDQIVGMTFLEPLALYLSLYRYVNGPGAVVKFPGTQRNFTYTWTESSQDLISKSEIYLSVIKPHEANGEAFNIADFATPSSWSMKWPVLTSYFGLNGVGPGDHGWEEIDVWWNEHQHDYRQMCKTYSLVRRELSSASWIFCKVGFTLLDRNRELCLDKIRNIGFTEELPLGKAHFLAFDRMAENKLIPSSGALYTSFSRLKDGGLVDDSLTYSRRTELTHG